MLEHETGTITAYRADYTHKENQARNKSLLLKLMDYRLQVTSVKGSYIQDYGTPEAQEVGEHTFFVVDAEDRGNLKSILMKLGEAFQQDSILYIEKGGSPSYLIGTNHTAEYPGYHNEIKLSQVSYGSESEFMTKVKGRPFVFKDDTIEYHLPKDRMGKWPISIGAKKHWREFIEDDSYDGKNEVVLVNKEQTMFEASGARNVAYWSRWGKAYEVDAKHINFVRENPEIFNLTVEEIRDTYRKHGEKFGLEGKAREEIMRNLMNQGWLRIRHYMRPDLWTIEFDKYSKRKKDVHRFVDWAVDHAGMSLNADLSLLGVEDGYNMKYTFANGGVQSFYFEESMVQEELELIEIKEDVIIGNVILEMGDKIKVFRQKGRK
jgi:hypothetical protein